MEKVIVKSGISGSTLKLIAIFTMLIDHIAATVILQMINNGIGGQTLIDIYWVCLLYTSSDEDSRDGGKVKESRGR